MSFSTESSFHICIHLGQEEPSFEVEPEPVGIERHTTINLSWLIRNGPCGSGSRWLMSIESQDLRLYLRGKLETPFDEDFNVTIRMYMPCDHDGRKRINVTLTIKLSDVVLQNVHFIRCVMRNGGENRTIESEKVYFNETVTVTTTTDSETTSGSTPCIQSTTSTSSQSSVPNSMPSTSSERETETNIPCSAAGTRPYLLLLCIIQCLLMCILIEFYYT